MGLDYHCFIVLVVFNTWAGLEVDWDPICFGLKCSNVNLGWFAMG